MDSVFIPRVEVAVRFVIGPWRHGPSSVVHNHDQRGYSGSTEDTPLITASSRSDLIIIDTRDDETRNNETIQGGEFLALRSKYNWLTHTHHVYCIPASGWKHFFLTWKLFVWTHRSKFYNDHFTPRIACHKLEMIDKHRDYVIAFEFEWKIFLKQFSSFPTFFTAFYCDSETRIDNNQWPSIFHKLRDIKDFSRFVFEYSTEIEKKQF